MKCYVYVLSALIFTNALAACDEGTAAVATDSTNKPQGAPVPPTLVMIEPGDLLSATGATPIRVWVDQGYEIVTDDVLQSVAKSVILVNLNTNQPVAFFTVIINPKKHGESAYVQVTPKAELDAEWHAVGLLDVRPELVLSASAANPPPVGIYAVRFNPSPSPTPRFVQGCAKPDGAGSVTVEFSEAVVLPTSDDTSAVTIAGAAGACHVVGAGDQAAGKGGSTPAAGKQVQFRCQGTEGPWHLKIQPGLKNADGTDVKMLDGKESLDVMLDTSKDSGPAGCWIHRF